MREFKVGDRIHNKTFGYSGEIIKVDDDKALHIKREDDISGCGILGSWLCCFGQHLTLLSKKVYVVYEHTALIPNGTPVMTEVGGRVHGVYKTKEAANKKKLRLSRDRQTYISVLTQKIKGE